MVGARLCVVVNAHCHSVLFADSIPNLPRGDWVFGKNARNSHFFGELANRLDILFASAAGDAKDSRVREIAAVRKGLAGDEDFESYRASDAYTTRYAINE